MPRDAMPIDPEPMDLPLKWWVVSRSALDSPRHPSCEFGIVEARNSGQAASRLRTMTGVAGAMTAIVDGPFDSSDEAAASVCGETSPEDFAARDDVELLPEGARP